MITLRMATDVDVPPITQVLHRAYSGLAERGLHFVATWQDDDITRKRMAGCECWVLVRDDGQLVGTVTLQPPGRPDGCAFYARPDVAVFGQFGVDPALRGRGLGQRLLDHCEARAAAMGAAWIGCDTAAPAAHLITHYERRGYQRVDTADWDATNYLSVVLGKRVASDIAALRIRVTAWAAGDADVRAVALVGSYARDAAGPESDIDLVVLFADAGARLTDTAWTSAFGDLRSTVPEDYGAVQSLRAVLGEVEIELGVTGLEWAALAGPLADPATTAVVAAGMVPWYDPDRVLPPPP
jgi:GNAT superfamily N-acetyltransferase